MRIARVVFVTGINSVVQIYCTLEAVKNGKYFADIWLDDKFNVINLIVDLYLLTNGLKFITFRKLIVRRY